MKVLIIHNKNRDNLEILVKSIEDNFLGKKEIIILDQNNILNQDSKMIKKVSNLKGDLINIIENDPKSNYIIIDENKFCYDIVDINLIEECLKNDDIFCFSLSLGNNITFCANMNCNNVFLPLKKENNILYWDWSVHYLDFGYPFNLDGTVYRGKELLKFIKNINFDNSIELENSLQIFDNYPKNIMCCFDKSKIIEIIFENKEEIHTFNFKKLEINKTKFLIKSNINNEIINKISN